MARTDKRKGRVKYIKLVALMADNQLRARYGRFWDHPILESVLICEGYAVIEGSTPLDADFDGWLAAEQKKHRGKVADFKKKKPAEYGGMLEVIGTNDGDGVDPRRRVALAEYFKMPFAVEIKGKSVYEDYASEYVRTGKLIGRGRGKKKMPEVVAKKADKLHWRFLPAVEFQKHLEKVCPRHFPPTETAESFMMFAKRAGLRFVGPKNAKTRKVSKRRKQ